jgi:anti-sigma B factor antagonist
MSTTVTVVVHEAGDHTVVEPHGRLYYDTLAPVRDALVARGSAERPRLVLDLSGVDMCDSSGLNLMAQTHRRVARHGGWLRLVGVQPNVRRVLDATNLTHLLGVYDTVDAAVAT